MAKLTAHKRPCPNCPWRRDAPVGHFPPEAFQRLAASAYDMDRMIFQCHDTTPENPVVCAGFLERGATHNLTVRLAYMNNEIEPMDRSGGVELFEDYREMAIANGVNPDDPLLEPCRRNDN